MRTRGRGWFGNAPRGWACPQDKWLQSAKVLSPRHESRRARNEMWADVRSAAQDRSGSGNCHRCSAATNATSHGIVRTCTMTKRRRSRTFVHDDLLRYARAAGNEVRAPTAAAAQNRHHRHVRQQHFAADQWRVKSTRADKNVSARAIRTMPMESASGPALASTRPRDPRSTRLSGKIVEFARNAASPRTKG